MIPGGINKKKSIYGNCNKTEEYQMQREDLYRVENVEAFVLNWAIWDVLKE